jgi:hypothetical protein
VLVFILDSIIGRRYKRVMPKDAQLTAKMDVPQASSSSSPSAPVAVEREEEAPILNFRKRSEEEEESGVTVVDRRGQREEEETVASLEPPPSKSSQSDEEKEEGKRFEFILTPRLLTTNTGIVELTTQLQKMLDAAVRGMLEDEGTPIHHPAVLGYINMHSACEQIKGVFRPQQVALTPEQIKEMQRAARGNRA